MTSNQASAAPPAGSTRPFQIAARLRLVRQRTSATQASVAVRATRKGSTEKLGTKPGASRATLAAGLGGTPVCSEIQITQITSAQPLKNSSVNQSIRAETLRSKVGSANAA